jgi:hypothetical protein
MCDQPKRTTPAPQGEWGANDLRREAPTPPRKETRIATTASNQGNHCSRKQEEFMNAISVVTVIDERCPS